MGAGEWGCGEELAHFGGTVKAEPKEFSKGLVVGRQLKRGLKHGSRVFGLSTSGKLSLAALPTQCP